VHAELVLGQHFVVGLGRVERLMRASGRHGVHRRRLRGCTRRDPKARPCPDLVERSFQPQEPDGVYVADITQHPTAEGWLYLAIVLDCSPAASSAGDGRPPPQRTGRRRARDGPLATPPGSRRYPS